ncbi:MAG TPA: DUF3224 domain-containing protein [Pseudonocardia sp.]|jgi:hypothetical protein
MADATGTFEITRWDEAPYDKAEGATLGRVTVGKTFRGALSGSSAAELLTATADVPGSAAYVGIERFTGTLDGRAGTFVLRHAAMMSGDGGDMTVVVLPDSGADELRTLRGELDITRHPDGTHSYALHYRLG